MAKGLSEPQRRTLFATIRAAARETGDPAEIYRKRIMREELGVEHLSQVSPATGFDTLMARICRDAGDYAGATRYADAAVGRFRRLIEDVAERIAPGGSPDYVAGVLIQSHMVEDVDRGALAARLASGNGWTALGCAKLRKLLAMLKIHLRRLQ